MVVTKKILRVRLLGFQFCCDGEGGRRQGEEEEEEKGKEEKEKEKGLKEIWIWCLSARVEW